MGSFNLKVAVKDHFHDELVPGINALMHGTDPLILSDAVTQDDVQISS